MNEMVIDFPAADDAQSEKMVKLLNDLGDCLETTIIIETVNTLRVKYDGSRAEVSSILKRLAGNKTGLKVKSKPKRFTTKPLRLSEQAGVRDIDPMGS